MTVANLKTICHYCTAAALVFAGLIGLYLKVDYSGWVLAVGLWMAA